MKKNLQILFLLVFSLNLKAQNFEFARSMGGNASDYGQSITVDISGNILTVGTFEGTADFDPSSGVYNLTSVGNNDIFIQKLDASGNFLWAASIGGNSFDFGFSICTDAFGNVYTTGQFSGTADFDPGIGVFNLTSPGSSSVFVQKLDGNGNLLWAKSMGGSSYASAYSIHISNSGNIYLTGEFGGTIDFDPGVGTFNMSSLGVNDVFVEKLDASGNLIWAKSFGGTSYDYGKSITTDASENVIITGYYQGTVDFNPSVTVFNLSSLGLSDVFVEKMDASGNFLWAKSMGGTSVDEANSVSVDAAGNIFILGRFFASGDFDPGAAVYNLVPVGGYDIFVEKLDANGNFMWVKSMGDVSSDTPKSIFVDGNNNVYSTGSFIGTVDFDPGTGVHNLTTVGPTGFDNTYVQKLDNNGNFLWAQSIGGFTNYSNAIFVDPFSNIYITGMFGSTVDFDPGAGVFNLTVVGGSDVYILKLSQCTPNSGSQSITACDSYTWSANGTTYTASGTYTAMLTNISGCDSTATLNLTITNSNSGSQSITACDSYAWSANGTTYTASGTYTAMLTNISGCDSTATLNLTITNSNSGSQSITTCYSYTWSANGTTYTTSGTYTAMLTNISGCDSTATLNLTINNSFIVPVAVEICQGDSYTLPDLTVVNSPGTYAVLLVATSGCDSLVVTTITFKTKTTINQNITICNGSFYTMLDGSNVSTSGVHTAILNYVSGCDSVVQQVTLTVFQPDTSVMLLSGGLLQSATTGFIYQWMDCISGNIMPGEINPIFQAISNGNYALIVEENGCVDTSACYQINFNSISENNQNGISINIFPNPVSDYLNISFDTNVIYPLLFTVYDLSGRELQSTLIKESGQIVFDFSIFPDGNYLLNVMNKDFNQFINIIKQ